MPYKWISVELKHAIEVKDLTQGPSSCGIRYHLSHYCSFSFSLLGILRTAVPDLDRETQDQYLIVLQAKDMGGHLGGLSGTTTVTVKLTDVNDNPPHFTQSESH